MKSEEGILQGEDREMEEVNLARLFAISLPRTPKWLGAQRNLIVKLA
jgi:hypothetical protein